MSRGLARAGSLLAAVFLVACGKSDDTISIVFDPCATLNLRPVGATDAQVASIGAAADLWNQWGATIQVGDSESADEEIPVRFDRAAPQFFGIYRDERGDVVINRSLHDPDERAIAIAHELGHAFGLEHVEGRRSVMTSGNLEVEPNEADADALSRAWPDCESVRPAPASGG